MWIAALLLGGVVGCVALTLGLVVYERQERRIRELRREIARLETSCREAQERAAEMESEFKKALVQVSQLLGRL